MQKALQLQKDSKKLNWSTVIGVTVFHALAIGALFTFSWQNLTAAAHYVVAGRQHRHRHRLSPPFDASGIQSSALVRAIFERYGNARRPVRPDDMGTTHRLHHAFTETDGDPHSPIHGTYWSHMGWIFRGTAQNNSPATMRRYSPDLMKDPVPGRS